MRVIGAPTSFPGGGKMRDSGNEAVGTHCSLLRNIYIHIFVSTSCVNLQVKARRTWTKWFQARAMTASLPRRKANNKDNRSCTTWLWPQASCCGKLIVNYLEKQCLAGRYFATFVTLCPLAERGVFERHLVTLWAKHCLTEWKKVTVL